MRLAVLSVLFIFGCASAPEIRYVPKEVKVPVMVPCEPKMPETPKWATKDVTPADTIFDKVKALAAELRQREGYEVLLLAAIAGCRQP